jgi:ParB family chromosome partitioning protein
VKRIIDQRRFAGKHRDIRNGAGRKRLTSAESLVHAYRCESQKQKLMIRKAKICDAKLLFIVTAFDKLVRDENFMTLLRAESLSTMPKYLWAKLNPKHKETA